MSSSIEQDLAASGVAAVIVVLKPGAAGAGAAAEVAAQQTTDISQYFTTSEHSQESALASDAQARVARGGGGDRTPSRTKAIRDAEASVAAGLDFRARPAVVKQPVPEAEPPPLVRYYPNLGVALGTVTRNGLAELRKSGQVDQVLGAPELGLIHPTRTAAASLRAKAEWGIQRLGAPSLWKKGITGKGIRVGHLDTGVDGNHPGLEQAITAFAEFDNLGRQVVPAPAPHDTGEHGTHTAGTIAGRPQGARNFGMAPGADLVCGIVIEGGQVVARVLGGMDWCIGEGVRILSMSLGLRGWWPDFLPLTQILRTRGVLPVFAVGNEGPGTSRSPGNYAEALSIGAIDRSNDIATFSSSQLFARPKDPIVPDVVAPGVGIISARPGGGYQSMDGTSMATPHIAGLAALLLEANPNATVDELEQAILGSSALKPGWAPERAGKGLPAARKALKIITT